MAMTGVVAGKGYEKVYYSDSSIFTVNAWFSIQINKPGTYVCFDAWGGIDTVQTFVFEEGSSSLPYTVGRASTTGYSVALKVNIE